MNRDLAIFLPSLAGGGAEKVMLALAERFVARGIRCDLLIAMHEGPLLDRVPPGVRLISFGKRKTNHAIPALVRYLRQEQPQTLLSTVFTANITALIASFFARSGMRQVICEANTTRNDIVGRTHINTVLNIISCKILYPRADAFIAISSAVQNELVAFVKIPQIKTIVIFNPAINNHADRDDKVDRERGLIVACGRLVNQKDYPTLLRAFSYVRKSQQSKLVILGTGPLLPMLKNMTHKLGLTNDVVFHGFEPDPHKWMSKAAVFAHSAAFEGFGVVLVEAMAAGCPIVCTDSPGGIREVLANGKFGTLVPVGDDEAMAKAILDILRGEVHFPDASEHLRQFDLDAVADAYLDVLFPSARRLN